MPVEVPGSAYQQFARGQLSAEELRELEKTAEFLNKEADFRGALAVGAGTAAGMTLATLGAHAFSRGVEAAVDKVTFGHDLNKVLKVHPDLKDYSKKDIQLAYQSIRTLSPTIARDPLMGGTLLGQVLRNRDMQSPNSAPRFDVTLAKVVSDTHKNLPGGELTKGLESSFQKGVDSGMGAYLDAKHLTEARTYAEAKEDAKLGEGRTYSERQRNIADAEARARSKQRAEGK